MSPPARSSWSAPARNTRLRTSGTRLFAMVAVVGGVLGFTSNASAAAPEYLVQFDGTVAAQQERADVARAGGRVSRDLHIIDALGARLSPHARVALRRTAGVSAVTRNVRVRTSGHPKPADLKTAYVQSVRADKVWKDNDDSPGAGVAVAVLDTGIAGDLTDFKGADGQSRVVASVVTNPDATTATDTYGHGTHVAGIIAGDGWQRRPSDPLRGAYRGTAPGASLVSIKVSDDSGATSLIDVIYGLQFAVDHKDELGIRVVNLSLDASTPQSYRTDPLDAASEAAWNAGIVVVAAAGNRGATPGAVDYAPANDPYVISVGAVDDAGTKDTGDDTYASWSSRGTTIDGVKKADVLAPGAHIVSTLAPGSAFAAMCPQCVVDGDYFQAGGTSMSAPVVSGVVALLLQAHPDWTPDMVKTALMATLRKTADGKDMEVNAKKAVEFDDFDRVPSANAGLTPSTLIDPATGTLDPSRASWSRASWSTAAGLLRASWSRASWSCVCVPDAGADGADPSRASWNRASWSRASWSTDWEK